MKKNRKKINKLSEVHKVDYNSFSSDLLMDPNFLEKR